jgi:hypothetical protein
LLTIKVGSDLGAEGATQQPTNPASRSARLERQFNLSSWVQEWVVSNCCVDSSLVYAQTILSPPGTCTINIEQTAKLPMLSPGDAVDADAFVAG